jgi:ribosome-associated protein
LNDTINAIKKALDFNKAENIEVFDVKDTDYFVDYVVVATSIASKHAIMLVDEIKKAIAPFGEKVLHVDDSDTWTVVDLGDALVHLMSDEYRKRYNLEEFLGEFERKRAARA